MDYQQILRTEQAITLVKDSFSQLLAQRLNLIKISSPIAVLDGTGINDDLNGIERPVAFPIKALNEQRAVVVHSLAKWKRLRLKQLGIAQNAGVLTNMQALRPDEDYSVLHSVYVDQWDWEQHISPAQRTLDFLKQTVNNIYDALRQTEKLVEQNYPEIKSVLPETITFIHSEQLLQQYPQLSPKERENAAARQYGAVFIIGIGELLSNGEAHDGRAPDYDDWSSRNEDGFNGLNGDILVWHPVLQSAFELSSMGIRVSPQSLATQLEKRNCKERANLYFHNLLLNGELPQSIGGGIGQSRVCMFMLKKSHIGQVQVGIWGETERAALAEEGVQLL